MRKKHQKKQTEKGLEKGPEKGPEKGSVIFIILIAIALFATLSYVVAYIMRSGNPETISEQKSKLYAGELLDSGRQFRQAVQNIRISGGCMDTEISFENSVVAGYTNAGAPSDNSCHVFDADGGALTWIDPSTDSNDGSQWVFTGMANVKEVGDDTNVDLLMVLPGVKQVVCEEVNDILKMGLSAIPVDGDDLDETKFTGSYTATDTISGDIGVPACPANDLCGQMAGCFREETAGQRYIFYQVLMAR